MGISLLIASLFYERIVGKLKAQLDNYKILSARAQQDYDELHPKHSKQMKLLLEVYKQGTIMKWYNKGFLATCAAHASFFERATLKDRHAL